MIRRKLINMSIASISNSESLGFFSLPSEFWHFATLISTIAAASADYSTVLTKWYRRTVFSARLQFNEAHKQQEERDGESKLW